MDIKTKFNMGDTVHYMYDDLPASGKIVGVGTFIGRKTHTSNNCGVHRMVSETMNVTYFLELPLTDPTIEDPTMEMHESRCYATREELKEKVFS